MINRSEWNLAKTDSALRARLIERETADYLALGGKITHGKVGEQGLVYVPGRGYVSRQDAHDSLVDQRAVVAEREYQDAITSSGLRAL